MGGWITMCNRHSKLLVQTVPHTVHSVLLVAQNAYDARDLDVNKKLHSYLGTLDAKIQEAVRPLICNPMTVEKALQLFSVPLWTDYLLNYEKLQWIRSSGFTDLVSVITFVC